MVILDQAGRGRPWLRIISAPPAIRDIVEHLWIEDSRGINESHRGPWRVVPDGNPHLIFGLVETKSTVRNRLSVVGARTVHTDIDRRGRVVTVGARLVPGVLPSLVNEDARSFTDRGTPLIDLLPRVARDLPDRLNGAHSSREIVQIVTEMVTHLRRSNGDGRGVRVANAVRLIDAAGGNVDIRRVAREAGFSTRTLRSMFAEHVGLTPKRYARVRRLHNAIHLAVGEGEPSLAGLASKVGYADQAHMTRDFRALLGETPGAYLRRGV